MKTSSSTPADLRFPKKTEVRKPELDMAKALVDSLAADWDPSKYTDQYRENLMKIIKGKAKGKHVALDAGEPKRPAQVIDLMERLRQSLAQTKAKPAKVDKRSRHPRRHAVV